MEARSFNVSLPTIGEGRAGRDKYVDDDVRSAYDDNLSLHNIMESTLKRLSL